MMQSARLSEKAMLREAVAGVIAKGSHRDPIVVACHILHVENYAAMVRRRFEGGGLVTAKFVILVCHLSAFRNAGLRHNSKEKV